MPQISLCPYAIPKSFSSYLTAKSKNHQQLHKKQNTSSKISLVTSKCSKTHSTKTNANLNVYGITQENEIKSINQYTKNILRAKSGSKRLFQKAKTIHNPQKQTYLSPQPRYLQKQSSQALKQKNVYTFRINVSNVNNEKNMGQKRIIKINKCKGPNVNHVEDRQKQRKTQIQAGKAQIQMRKTAESNFEIDQEEKINAQKNSLFKSSDGRKLLRSLQKELKNICSIKRNHGQEEEQKIRQIPSELQKRKSKQLKALFRVPNVESISMRSSVQLQFRDSDLDLLGQYEQNKEKQNKQNYEGINLSELIMESDFLAKPNTKIARKVKQ